MSAVVAALVVVVAALVVLVVGLLRSHAMILRALHDAGVNLDPDGPSDPTSSVDLRPTVELRSHSDPVIRTIDGVAEPLGVSGRKATDLVGATPDGGVRSVAMKARENTLIAFLSTGCGTCAGFWNAFREGVNLPAGTRLVIVTKGPQHESPADVVGLAPSGTTVIMSSEAWDDFGVPVAPYFVMVEGASGVAIGEGAAHSWDLVEQLLHRAVADAQAAAAPKVSRRDIFLGRKRQADTDAELERAGLVPGDARLYHRTIGEDR